MNSPNFKTNIEKTRSEDSFEIWTPKFPANRSIEPPVSLFAVWRCNVVAPQITDWLLSNSQFCPTHTQPMNKQNQQLSFPNF